MTDSPKRVLKDIRRSLKVIAAAVYELVRW
jgi:hypothetical protein